MDVMKDYNVYGSKNYFQKNYQKPKEIIFLDPEPDYLEELKSNENSQNKNLVYCSNVSEFIVKYLKHQNKIKCLVINAYHIPELIERSIIHGLSEVPIVVTHSKSLPENFKKNLSFRDRVFYVHKKFGIRPLLSKVSKEAKQFLSETNQYFS